MNSFKETSFWIGSGLKAGGAGARAGAGDTGNRVLGLSKSKGTFEFMQQRVDNRRDPMFKGEPEGLD